MSRQRPLQCSGVLSWAEEAPGHTQPTNTPSGSNVGLPCLVAGARSTGHTQPPNMAAHNLKSTPRTAPAMTGAGPGTFQKYTLPPPPFPPRRTPTTHRQHPHGHGGISLPPAPRWGSGINIETRQPEAEAQSRQRGHTGSKDAQAVDPRLRRKLRPDPTPLPTAVVLHSNRPACRGAAFPNRDALAGNGPCGGGFSGFKSGYQQVEKRLGGNCWRAMTSWRANRGTTGWQG